MQSLIDESVGALFAAVVEQIHKFAQVCMFPHFFSTTLFEESAWKTAKPVVFNDKFQDVTQNKLVLLLFMFYGWQQ